MKKLFLGHQKLPMKKLSFFILLVLQATILYAQKFPIEWHRGHLLTHFTINAVTNAKVFLESGFSQLLIDKQFAEKHLKSNPNLKFTTENSSVATWGTTKHIRTEGIVRGLITINGKEIWINGVLIDISEQPDWKGLDMVFPIKDFNQPVYINYQEHYLTLGIPQNEELKAFHCMLVDYDENTKGLYADGTLSIGNSPQKQEFLKGNFLFDLGASNPVYLNRNHPEVEAFLVRTQDFLLKDTSKIGTHSVSDLAVLLPKKMQLGKLEQTDGNIVVMRIPITPSNQRYVGMIGNQFLEHCIIIFDFENRKMYFKSVSDKFKIYE